LFVSWLRRGLAIAISTSELAPATQTRASLTFASAVGSVFARTADEAHLNLPSAENPVVMLRLNTAFGRQ
jgi:hypothetical protein